jgi:hypothetical protein
VLVRSRGARAQPPGSPAKRLHPGGGARAPPSRLPHPIQSRAAENLNPLKGCVCEFQHRVHLLFRDPWKPFDKSSTRAPDSKLSAIFKNSPSAFLSPSLRDSAVKSNRPFFSFARIRPSSLLPLSSLSTTLIFPFHQTPPHFNCIRHVSGLSCPFPKHEFPRGDHLLDPKHHRPHRLPNKSDKSEHLSASPSPLTPIIPTIPNSPAPPMPQFRIQPKTPTFSDQTRIDRMDRKPLFGRAPSSHLAPAH